MLVLALVVLTATGCASGSGIAPRTADDPPATQIVFQVEAGGGMEPGFVALARRPALTVYGDGRAFTIMEGRAFTGAPPGLAQAMIAPSTLRRLIGTAALSGVFADADFGDPRITDVGGTTLTFRPTTGPAKRVYAYALGYPDAENGLTDTEQHNRQELRQLIKELFGAVRPRASGEYRPNRVDVIGVTNPYGTAPARPVSWPGPGLAEVLTRQRSSSRCGVLSGDAARRVYLAARHNSSIYWTADGKVRQLIVRPLLPGERGCSR